MVLLCQLTKRNVSGKREDVESPANLDCGNIPLLLSFFAKTTLLSFLPKHTMSHCWISIHWDGVSENVVLAGRGYVCKWYHLLLNLCLSWVYCHSGL